MNVAELVAEVPSGFVTFMVTAPAVCAGVFAAIDVALTLVTVAAVPPKLTVAPDWKFVPGIVTAVPPAVVPELGDTPVTVTVVPANVTGFDIRFRTVGFPTAFTYIVWDPEARFIELSGMA